jgi:hypothetical protein
MSLQQNTMQKLKFIKQSSVYFKMQVRSHLSAQSPPLAPHLIWGKQTHSGLEAPWPAHKCTPLFFWHYLGYAQFTTTNAPGLDVSWPSALHCFLSSMISLQAYPVIHMYLLFTFSFPTISPRRAGILVSGGVPNAKNEQTWLNLKIIKITKEIVSQKDIYGTISR